MKRTRSVLAGVLLAVAIPAQAGAPSGARTERDKLAAEWTAATKTYSEAMKAAQQSDEWKAASTAKDRKKLDELMAGVPKPDAAAIGARALAAAEKFAGDDRLLLLCWAATNTNDPATVKSAVEAIEKDHLQSPALVDLLEVAPALSRAVGDEGASRFLAAVVAASPHALPRAWAMYWQAQRLQRGKDDTAEQKAQAEKLLADAESLAAGTPLADRLAAPRFEQERLQIGMEAPDIAGEDLDGVAFKLSDYRGKVVVLDFWGFW